MASRRVRTQQVVPIALMALLLRSITEIPLNFPGVGIALVLILLMIGLLYAD